LAKNIPFSSISSENSFFRLKKTSNFEYIILYSALRFDKC
jgi:hypothetical protein